MLVQVYETKYVVSWQHSLPGIVKIGSKDIKTRGSTSCTIRKLNKNGSFSAMCRYGRTKCYGSARCSVKDQYSKNEGRKLSLERAVSYFKKSQRKKFWEAYAEMRGGKF